MVAKRDRIASASTIDLVRRRFHGSSVDAGDAQRPLAVAHREIARYRESFRQRSEGWLGQAAEDCAHRNRAAQPEEMDAEAVGARFRPVDEPVPLHGCQQAVNG
jgi:hypothetical protein